MASSIEPLPCASSSPASSSFPPSLEQMLKREEDKFVDLHPKSKVLFERGKKYLVGGVPMNWMVRWGPYPGKYILLRSSPIQIAVVVCTFKIVVWNPKALFRIYRCLWSSPSCSRIFVDIISLRWAQKEDKLNDCFLSLSLFLFSFLLLYKVFVKEAQGAQVVDVDNVKYLDLCLGDTGTCPPPNKNTNWMERQQYLLSYTPFLYLSMAI